MFPQGYKETKEKPKAEQKPKAYPEPHPQPSGNANNGMNPDSKINVKQFDPSLGYPVHIKILTLGPQGCGKSCMVKRLCENKFVNR